MMSMVAVNEKPVGTGCVHDKWFVIRVFEKG